MRIRNKKSLARLASISALGAGALAVASPALAPGVINSLTGKVGFSSGYGSSAKLSFAGTQLNVFRSSFTTGRFAIWSVYAAGLKSAFHIKLSAAALGKTWNSLTNHSSTGVGLGARICSGSSCQLYAPAGDVYRLFRFKSGGKTLYGWLEYAVTGSASTGPNMDLTGSASTGPNADLTGSISTGPNVNLIALAWDPSGNKLPAGRAPAPSSIPVAPPPILAGIAALILGAEGYRSWRAARNNAA